MNYKQYFKNKKILIMGLGLLGRGVNVAKFLVKQGALLTITDLKNEKELLPSLKSLKKFKNIKYILGGHRLVDFKNKDMVIRAANVPLKSIYLSEANKNKIPIEMDASLFAKFCPAKIIGITGTRGKSTVTKIIFHILKFAGRRAFLGGNIKGLATLPLLEKIKQGDWVVLELDSWQLNGFGASKISPHISVFTNFLSDHMNYYNNSMKRYFDDKANIFKYQSREDYLVLSSQAKKEIRKRYKNKIESQIVEAKNISPFWKNNLLGEHNKINIALAAKVLEVIGVKKNIIKKGIASYKGEPGRLELIRHFKGIDYYNDTNATTPDATIAALKAFNGRRIILIAGGADKNLDYDIFVKKVKKTVKKLILIKGSATDKIINLLGSFSYKNAENMEKAFVIANQLSQKGDLVLLSPAAASFGVFKNEYDRGEQFNKFVAKLK